MKTNKSVVLFGALLIALLLTSSTFSLAEPTNEIQTVQDMLTESNQIGLYYIAQNGQRYCNYGCCGGWYCKYGGGSSNNNNNNNNNGGGGGNNNNNNNNNRGRCIRYCHDCCGRGGQFSGSFVQGQP